MWFLQPKHFLTLKTQGILEEKKKSAVIQNSS